jgi:hypothetical protein
MAKSWVGEHFLIEDGYSPEHGEFSSLKPMPIPNVSHVALVSD